MYNSVVLVGRTTMDVNVTSLESGLKVASMHLAVQRPFLNSDNEYDVDFIEIKLFEGIAQAVSSNCKKGSLVLVKGRIAIRKTEINEKKYTFTDVIGERVVFLNLKHTGTKQEEIEEFCEDL